MAVTRLPDWEARFAAFLAAHAAAEHVFGTLDCALFAANGVAALTGVDLAAEYRGRYSTAIGARRALRRYGAGSLSTTIDTKLPQLSPAFARRGDVVVANDALGLCIGADAVFVGEDRTGAVPRVGLIRYPRAAWQLAWAVG